MTKLCLNYDDDKAVGTVLWQGVLEEEKKMSALLLLRFQHFTRQPSPFRDFITIVKRISSQSFIDELTGLFTIL